MTECLLPDLNGDGLNDIVGLGNSSWSPLTTYAYINYASLDTNGNVRFTDSKNILAGTSLKMPGWDELLSGGCIFDMDGDGINELIIPNYSSIDDYGYKAMEFRFPGGTMISKTAVYKLATSGETPFYAIDDINNDGVGDIIILEKRHNNGNFGFGILGYNPKGENYYATTYLNLPNNTDPEKIFVADFNGNGLKDLIVFNGNGYTIFWNQGIGIRTNTFLSSKTTSGTNISGGYWTMMRPGDFNGDGLMDFIFNNGDSNWYFALNKGDGTFTKLIACTLAIHDQSFTSNDDDKFQVLVYDFDGDGKSDVVISKAMYLNKNDLDKTYTYWMRSNGASLTQVSSATSTKDWDARPHRYVIGDFNGDGQGELMNFGYNCYNSMNASANPIWRLYKNTNYRPASGKVNGITDSYGSKTTITYASFASDKDFYKKGTGSTYPLADYTPPLHAVKSVTVNNGIAGNVITNYEYSGLKAHLQGKGFLGLTSQKTNNITQGIVIESGVKSWNTTFFVPAETYTKTIVDEKTSETSIKLAVTDKGSKKYSTYLSSKIEKDLDGNTITTTYQFNTTYNYPTEEKVDFGNGMYKTMQYANYIVAGGSYKPKLVTLTQKHTDDQDTYTKKTAIDYDVTKGYRKQVIENQGTPLQLTTDYTYDNIGNVLTLKESGSGISPVTINNEYDVTRRFLTKTYTAPASLVTTYTHDIWGNILTEKDETLSSNILTTTHSYDNWGKYASTILPDGQKKMTKTGWNNNTTKRYFILTQATGQPWVKTWYDNKGREVLVETIGERSMSVQHKTGYNGKGQIVSKQVTSGNLTTSENYTYDARGRITTSSNSAGQNVSFTYENRKVNSVTNGKTYIKTFDAWGGVKLVVDPVSSIEYTYYSLGKPKDIKTGDATFSMTYDAVGNQSSLTDPNAGKYTYSYDAAGRRTEQVDGSNKKTVNKYDALGRLLTSSIDEIITAYTYGTSGYDLHRLAKVQTGNNYFEYTYDKYGRTLIEKQNIDGSGLLEFTYSYDIKGQLSSTLYPGNIQVNRQYDAYGNLSKVLAGTQAIWESTAATGTVFTSQLGGTLTATKTYNTLGLLLNQKTLRNSDILHSIDYAFDGATGNLNSRLGMQEKTEYFTYDNMDRLTKVDVSATNAMNIDYKPNGNINSKTSLGQYGYDSSKPHAVNSIDNTGNLISTDGQKISYTPFNKVSAVREKIGADSLVLNFTYGPDQQRWKTELKKNNILQKTIIFGGNYETVTENGATKQLYYISGGDGLAAIYVKQSGQADKIYYVHSDHLGSIVRLTDSNGSEVFRATYGAWGDRNVRNNTFAFHRGYTGHEHLEEFKLINMNGRMYDPLLGRFLSPDPFVQLPDFSQNFNRFSYAWNNPLRYTDPSGEFIPLIIVGAIIAGGIVNVAMNWDNINNFEQGAAYFGVGALGTGLIATGNIPLGGAVMGGGNSILTQGFQNGFDYIAWDQVGISAVTGGALAYIGGGISQKLQGPLSNLFSSVGGGSALQQGLSYGANGAITGFTLGTGMGLLTGEDFDDALALGGKSAAIGFGFGFGSGVYKGYQQARIDSKNPWTGRPVLRTEYERMVKGLKLIDAELKSKGYTEKQRAIELHRMRRELGEIYKNATPPELLDKIYTRNLQRYGDKYGPTIDYLRNVKEKSWSEIINGAYTPGGKDFNF